MNQNNENEINGIRFRDRHAIATIAAIQSRLGKVDIGDTIEVDIWMSSWYRANRSRLGMRISLVYSQNILDSVSTRSTSVNGRAE